jgi:hypothetical protein
MGSAGGPRSEMRSGPTQRNDLAALRNPSQSCPDMETGHLDSALAIATVVRNLGAWHAPPGHGRDGILAFGIAGGVRSQRPTVHSAHS